LWSARSSTKRIFVEKGVGLEAFEDGLRAELGSLRREDLRIGPERDGGAGAPARRLSRRTQLLLDLASVVKRHAVVLAVERAVDLE